MKKLFVLAVLSLTSAQAASTPIDSVLSATKGSMTFHAKPQSRIVVTALNRDQQQVLLGIEINDLTPEWRVRGISVLAFQNFLSADDFEVMIKMTQRLATSCFNLSPDRNPAIPAWLTHQSSTLMRSASANFGPMYLRFFRVKLDGSRFTGVYMNRTGTPGTGAWVNWCTQ